MAEPIPIVPTPPGESPPGARLTTLQKVEYLRRAEIFSDATVEELFELAAIAKGTSFAAGQVIFRENDVGEALYVVIVGEVELSARENDFRKTIGPGQPFGVYATLTRGPRSATAKALVDTLALCLGAEDLYHELSQKTEIVVSIFRYLIRRASLDVRE